MTILEKITGRKNSKEDYDAFYEVMNVHYKNIKSEAKRNPNFAKMAELLSWNTEIEKLEEGSETGHTLRVASLSKKLAEELKLSDEEIKTIYLAALFHDIGKHKIPAKIVGKQGPLTDDEYKIMKTHVELAEGILKGVMSDDVIKIILDHHERMDGKGYPRGIVPESIGAKIIGLVDSYDAMTSHRVYRTPKSKDFAFQELKWCTIPKEQGGMGCLYDASLVDLLIKIEK